MFKRISTLICCSFWAAGCASAPTRTSQFISETFNDQIQKKIIVFTAIDARPDKTKDIRYVLTKKGSIDDLFIPLRNRGYIPQFIDIDTSACPSLVNVKTIGELGCLGGQLDKGDLFLVMSIDGYRFPQGAGVIGKAETTAVLYSKTQDAFIWRDSTSGNFGGGNVAAFGLGGYTGFLLLKAIDPNIALRNDSFAVLKQLFDSIPRFPKKSMK
jgi:hypothetical protein